MVTWCPGENISFFALRKATNHSNPFSWLTSFWWCHHREQETTVWDHFSTPTDAFCWLLVNLSARMTSNVGGNITSLCVTLMRRHNIRHGILRSQHMKCFYMLPVLKKCGSWVGYSVSLHIRIPRADTDYAKNPIQQKMWLFSQVIFFFPDEFVCVTQYVQPLWTFCFS